MERIPVDRSISEDRPEHSRVWLAPYYDAERPDVYHTSPECSVGSRVPEHRRRIEVAVMREGLPGW